MSRLTNRILLAACSVCSYSARHRPFAGFQRQDAAACPAARGDGEPYGTNPYEQTGEEGEEGQDGQPQDTTKKERRIRKPLESYFSAIRSAP